MIHNLHDNGVAGAAAATAAQEHAWLELVGRAASDLPSMGNREAVTLPAGKADRSIRGPEWSAVNRFLAWQQAGHRLILLAYIASCGHIMRVSLRLAVVMA
jgi:hypothetical protein